MPDKGIARVVARELFGLCVRLTGWAMVASFLFIIVAGGARFENDGGFAFVGMLVGLLVIWKAEWMCRLGYGRRPDEVDA